MKNNTSKCYSVLSDLAKDFDQEIRIIGTFESIDDARSSLKTEKEKYLELHRQGNLWIDLDGTTSETEDMYEAWIDGYYASDHILLQVIENDYHRLDTNENSGEDDNEETIFSGELEQYNGSYDKRILKKEGLCIVEWPESQELCEMPNFWAHAWLINDPYGLKRFGSCAYVVEEEWWMNKNID